MRYTTAAIALVTALTIQSVFAAPAGRAGTTASGTIRFDYRSGEDLIKVIGDYAKASGQRFIIDPAVHGRITIINPDPVPLNEAFNQLSLSLATNGIGISTREDVMYVTHARGLQRDLIPVVHEPPPVNPERMVTWIVDLKNVSADEVNAQLRVLTSKDGELVPFKHGNQLIVSDWTSNLRRIADILAQIDKPAPKIGSTPQSARAD